MSRKWWLVAFLALIVVLFFRHGGTPMILGFPTTAKMAGNEVRVPVKVALPGSQDAPYWTLSRRGENGPYLVTVFENGKSIAQFAAETQGTTTSDGTNYPAKGTLQVVNTVYNASAIHVSTDGHNGYIVMKPANDNVQNNTGGNSANSNAP